MRLKIIFAAFLIIGTAWAQDPPADPPADAPADADGCDKDCEEAWLYLEFLKTDVKEKIESILQEKLFKQNNLIAQTVEETLEEVLMMRDGILARLKELRTGKITICPKQNVKQEPFLTMLRMDIMTILLKLIDEDKATFTAEKLQEIGTDLLRVRSKVNDEITRMIMLRDCTSAPPPPKDCDCEIWVELSTCLSAVVDKTLGDDQSPIDAVTMCLMTADARIRILYQGIFQTLVEEDRGKLKDELDKLKEISTELNDVLSDMIEIEDITSEDGMAKLDKIITRGVSAVLVKVKRLLKQCQSTCGTCDSCGAKKIDELTNKLMKYLDDVEQLEDAESLESVRNDLMTYLSEINKKMTGLLETKVNSDTGTLEKCEQEELDVCTKIKGPLWMMVNITIFGDEALLTDMITNLKTVLVEMRNEYCEDVPVSTPATPTDSCELEEIESAGTFIADIDIILQEHLFKPEDPAESRKEANLKVIQLKSSMEERIQILFKNGVICKEEIDIIKGVYMTQLNTCMLQMMNPSEFDLETLKRPERVDCLKKLRIAIEDRRGELLQKEIENRITG